MLQIYNDLCIRSPWYVVENDLTGGWAIGLYDKPLSEYNFKTEAVVADMFSSREMAALIVDVMNRARGFFPPL